MGWGFYGDAPQNSVVVLQLYAQMLCDAVEAVVDGGTNIVVIFGMSLEVDVVDSAEIIGDVVDVDVVVVVVHCLYLTLFFFLFVITLYNTTSQKSTFILMFFFLFFFVLTLCCCLFLFVHLLCL